MLGVVGKGYWLPQGKKKKKRDMVIIASPNFCDTEKITSSRRCKTGWLSFIHLKIEENLRGKLVFARGHQLFEIPHTFTEILGLPVLEIPESYNFEI